MGLVLGLVRRPGGLKVRLMKQREPSSPLLSGKPGRGFVVRVRHDGPSPPPISGWPEMGYLLRKSGTPDLRWGGGGGVCAIISDFGAGTPTWRFALALPTRGREKRLHILMSRTA